MRISDDNDKRTIEMVFRRDGTVWVGAYTGRYLGEYSEAIELDRTQATRLAENIIKFNQQYQEPSENGLYYTNQGKIIMKNHDGLYAFLTDPTKIYLWSDLKRIFSDDDYPITRFNQESFQSLFNKATRQ